MADTMATEAMAADAVAGPGAQPPRLLSDDEVLLFITHGYHLLHPEYADGLNEAIAEQCARADGVGNEILDRVPLLHQVYAHPEVRGALASLLGSDYVMNGHRHLHVNTPGSRSQNWHQDGTNVRHHQVWCVLAMYYPHEVPMEQGPTIIMPGTHFRNAPTDRLATYTNIKGQVPLAVPAGTVAITHYDLWHAATRNRTERTRYMLKFLFDRRSAPTAPSWKHDPQTVTEIAERRIREQIGPFDHASDYYKAWELRTEMWQWMLGRGAPVPPGAFKDMLS